MPKRKIDGKFTPRIAEMLDLMSKDCSYKMAGDRMDISFNGINSLMRNAREISGMHYICALYRKSVEDGDNFIEVKTPAKSNTGTKCPFEFPPFRSI